MRPAVFLDRDGTLIEERGYLDRLDLLDVYPWTPDAIRLLNRAGFAVVVVTNQSGNRPRDDRRTLCWRGACGARRAARRRERTDRPLLLLPAPSGGDARALPPRLPLPEARARHDRAGGAATWGSTCSGRSWSATSGWTSPAGRRRARASVLVRTGHGADEEAHAPEGARADAILNNLMEAVGWILRRFSGSLTR